MDLKRLLAAKHAIYRADPTGGYGGVAGGVDALGGVRGFEDTGGANVMTLGE